MPVRAMLESCQCSHPNSDLVTNRVEDQADAPGTNEQTKRTGADKQCMIQGLLHGCMTRGCADTSVMV